MTAAPSERAGNIVKWLGLLESGELTQVEGVLRSDKGYCCLGVVCKALRLDFERFIVTHPLYDGNTLDSPHWKCNEQEFNLPQEAAEAFGFYSLVGDIFVQGGAPARAFGFEPGDHLGTLQDMNDDFKLTFKEIAEHVRFAPTWFFSHLAPDEIEFIQASGKKTKRWLGALPPTMSIAEIKEMQDAGLYPE